MLDSLSETNRDRSRPQNPIASALTAAEQKSRLTKAQESGVINFGDSKMIKYYDKP